MRELLRMEGVPVEYALIFSFMSLFDKLYKRCISSDKLFFQCLGALIQWRARAFWTFIMFVVPLSVGISLILAPSSIWQCLLLLGLNLLVWLIIKVCRTLTEIFNLKKDDNGITTCQIVTLAMMGIWFVGFVLIFDLEFDGRVVAAMGIIGAVLGWIFQDRVKGVISFIHLRRHHLLNLGDWIKVPNLNVDGVVEKVTLTTVTFSNWDTTTSTIPIDTLRSEHFVNLQNMVGGKTYGRRMQKNFTLDTSWIHPITEDEAQRLKSGEHDIASLLSADEIRVGALNANLYRLYLYHWLMNNDCISHKPNLVVRWMDPKDVGMELQIYAFIINSDLATFEWQQSQIIEHVITSLSWFGLRLYQSPSAYDVSYSNIHIDNPELFEKEVKDEKEI